MKPVVAFFVIFLCIIYPPHLFSQCAGSTAAFTIKYDTVVYGNGNASLALSFPKFDPSVGTLLSANLQSVVGMGYSYSLENQTPMDKIFKSRIVRTDDISSTALDPSFISAINQTPFVSSLILSQQLVNYGPSNMNYILKDSVKDGRLINFMGAGNVDFDYETGTSASVQGPAPFQLSFTSVTDTMHFSLTYRYCTATLLSADLLFFSATPLKDKILLNWRQSNIEENRQYSVQVSTDGQNFSTVAAVAENKTGVYSYAWLNNASGNLYFRIGEKNASGNLKYSNIREIKAYQHTQTVARVFPSLYTGGSLHINFPYKADWQVRFYSAEGRRISDDRQTGVYSSQMELPALFSNGIYTVEIIDAQTRQKQVTRIVVQR